MELHLCNSAVLSGCVCMLNSYQGCRLGWVMCSKVGQIKPFFSVSTEKKIHRLEVENHGLFHGLCEGLSPGCGFPDGAESLLWRGKGGAKTYTSSATKIR